MERRRPRKPKFREVRKDVWGYEAPISEAPLVFDGINAVHEQILWMNSEQLWFQPWKLEEANQVIPTVNQILSLFERQVNRHRIPGYSFQQAWDTSKDIPRDLAEKHGRIDVREAAWGLANRTYGMAGTLEGVRNALGLAKINDVRNQSYPYITAKNAAWNAGHAAAFEAIADLPEAQGITNVHALLLDAHQWGAGRIMTEEINGRERLLWHLPLILPDDSRMLACMQVGDTTPYYQHEWNQRCSGITSFQGKPKEPRPLRIFTSRSA